MSSLKDWRYTDQCRVNGGTTHCVYLQSTRHDIVHCMWWYLLDPLSPTKRLDSMYAFMGRSWGQRSLIKCNWILLEGSLVPRPHLRVGRAWKWGYLDSAGKFNFLLCFWQRKGKRNSWFWIPFMLSSEKGKGNALFKFFYWFLQKKRKGTNHSEFLLCFLQIMKKECMIQSSFFVSFRKRKNECIILKCFCCV